MNIVHNKVNNYTRNLYNVIDSKELHYIKPKTFLSDIISDKLLEKVVSVVQVASLGISTVVIAYTYLFLLAKFEIGI